ncbi:hypothetical protein [Burkholderia pseudomallei]|uniref:hypothetical protein n=1 Tax=Burkholderia pseudomallei TaxID=28450 RepID=UPI000F135B54|nr:hypothetical protein [Burkholderia pseudomallei]VBM94820.1 gp43 [Burkholderia pseudomallei]
MTTTDKSRADALTDQQLIDMWSAANYAIGTGKGSKGAVVAMRAILAVSPIEQPAAAPIDDHECVYENGDGICRECAELAKVGRTAPSPVDERTASFETWCDRFPEISAVERLRDAWQEARAALPEDRIDWIANTHCPGGTAYPVNVKNAIREALREARISDNETGAEGAIVGAWLTEDGRAISAEQKAGMLRDGGAGASSVQPYSIPCYLGAASAMAAEAVAFEITEQAAAEWASRHDVDHVLKHFSTQRNAIEDARTLHLLAAAPQPAQAGARVGLTDAARDVLDERHRQIYAEGWTPAHDDQHDECEMALAAIVYAESAVGYHPSCPDTWPWSPKWFKPTTPRRDLVKAGALILAELERLDRAALLNGADHDQ